MKYLFILALCVLLGGGCSSDPVELPEEPNQEEPDKPGQEEPDDPNEEPGTPPIEEDYGTCEQDANAPIGFACVEKTPTGGAGGANRVVTTASELENALKSTEALTIYIKGVVEVTSMIKVQARNKTILGLSGSALTNPNRTAKGSGILYFREGSDNLILRNITFKSAGAYDVDGNDNLCIDGTTNIWVDHCDFQDGVDGNFDAIVGMCSAIYPGATADTFYSFYLGLGVVPFNLLRYIIMGLLTFLLYKRLSKILHWEGTSLRHKLSGEYESGSEEETFEIAKRDPARGRPRRGQDHVHQGAREGARSDGRGDQPHLHADERLRERAAPSLSPGHVPPGKRGRGRGAGAAGYGARKRGESHRMEQIHRLDRACDRCQNSFRRRKRQDVHGLGRSGGGKARRPREKGDRLTVIGA